MPKHTDNEIKLMINIVDENIKTILRIMDVPPSRIDLLSNIILKKNLKRIASLLDRPYGGTFPPEEIAEVLVGENIEVIRKFTSEAAASVC